jgi:hypothetical protein
MRTDLWPIVLVAMAIAATAAASPGLSGSLLLNPSSVVSVPGQVSEAPAIGWALAPPGLSPATSFVSRVDHSRGGYLQRVRRPRPYGSPMSSIPFTAQIHAGFYDPFDNFSTGFNGGFRIGPQPDPHIQLGLGMDWWHRTQDKELDLGRVQAPGGSASEQLILSESTADLVPILLFVQVSGDENMPVIPYGGFGAGHEWLFLTANDFVTHESFDQTFGGFGWQVWGGASLPLDWRMRLNGEVFFNECKVGTEVDVNIPGYGPATVRDVIDVTGMGVRFGASWQF